jgi:hypothetical protein
MEEYKHHLYAPMDYLVDSFFVQQHVMVVVKLLSGRREVGVP